MAYENRKVYRVVMQERIKKFGLIRGQGRGVKIGHRFVYIMCNICQLVGRDLDNNRSQTPFQWAVKQCQLDKRVHMEGVNRQNMERTSGNPKSADNTRYPGQ